MGTCPRCGVTGHIEDGYFIVDHPPETPGPPFT